MPLCSVWKRLPGERHGKEKCREVGGRMDTGREHRGGEVDKEKKKGVKFIRGWEEEEEEDREFKWNLQIREIPKPR